MVNKTFRRKSTGGGYKRRLRLLAASLALTTLLPANLTFAEEVTPAEEVAAPVEKVAAPDETAVDAETNVDYLNYLELEDFLITAERIPTNKWETPANVTVITAREIEENHYQSIDEALSHVNGVVVSSSYIQMNGGSRVLVLVDGRRWFDPQVNTQEQKALTWFPSMKMIERIEVVKGGNSALYGSDAFSGVVNIVTKKGTRNETTVDLSTSTNRHHRGHHQYELTNQGTVGKFGWFLAGRLYNGHPWEYKSGYNDFGASTTADKEHDISVRLDQRFTDRDSLTLDFMHISHDSKYYSPAAKEYGYSSNSVINNVSLSYNFKEGTSTPGWLRYINNYYTYSDLGTENPHARLQGIEYQNGWEFGQHKLIAGLEWHKSTASDVLHGFESKSINTKSVYLQDTIAMGDKWRLIPGARYDHSSKFGSHWSPKVAANYRPDEKTKFYATWGKSYNVPLIRELYSVYPDDENTLRARATGEFRLSNPNLRPEKGYSAIIGIEHDFSDKVGVGINYFYSKMDDLIGWGIDKELKTFQLYQAGNYYPMKSRGFEITFRQKIDDHFGYNLGYSHTHTHLDTNDGDAPYYRPQPNGYRVGLNYHNRGLKANLLGIMASNINIHDRAWGDAIKMPSYPTRRYAILDFNLSYDLNDNVNFYFKALNLTNQHYSNEESTLLNGVRTDYPASGRQFIYGVNCKF